MKKFKLFIIAAVLMASCFAGLTTVKAAPPVLMTCDVWIITCFSDFSTHEVIICASSEEAERKAVAKAIEMFCAPNQID